MSFSQRSGGPSAGKELMRFVSVEVLFARGPRNWGQSSAWAVRTGLPRHRKKGRARKRNLAKYAQWPLGGVRIEFPRVLEVLFGLEKPSDHEQSLVIMERGCIEVHFC